MTRLVTRRTLVKTGIAAAASVSGIGAALDFAGKYQLIPPDSGGILGVSETLTYSAQRLLTSGQALAREFSREQISAVSPVNGGVPMDAGYAALRMGCFRDYRLTVEGAVARSISLSLAELQQLPRHTHITLHACEEGWSYIAEWTGVRLSTVLDLVQPAPGAKYAVFVPYANPSTNSGAVRVSISGIGMADALHPQTLLAYGMNGGALPAEHGAPLRLRVSRLLGYKNTKFISRIVITENSEFYHRGNNSWFGGI
jgi:DMSO/TMAO reductase YedYZ molybdopterin-dependent catalytic subunit